jgi:nanoRNase/pAp phosphatase (c-di-AMP/oligoRNAs hydrolase)
MVKRRRKYDKEFKLMAVELMETDKSVREIAEDVDVKKELREAELERDILKKAVSIPVCRQAGSPRTMANIPIHKGSLLCISH